MKTIRKFALWSGIAMVVTFATAGAYLFSTFQAKREGQSQTPQLNPAERRGCASNEVYRSLAEAVKQAATVCTLDLSNKHMVALPPEILQFVNLRTLYLNSNNLTSLPPFTTALRNLELIDLTGNPMDPTSVDEARSLLPNAKILFIQPMNLP